MGTEDHAICALEEEWSGTWHDLAGSNGDYTVHVLGRVLVLTDGMVQCTSCKILVFPLRNGPSFHFAPACGL
jgi:hypothetical protein